MKIVCINNIEQRKNSSGEPYDKRLPITPGKTYDGEPSGYEVDWKTFEVGEVGPVAASKVSFYKITDEDGEVDMIYPSAYFVTLEEWRERQLDKLIE